MKKKLILANNRLIPVSLQNLKETRNSYFCVTPKNPRLMFHENIKKHCHKKVNVCFYNLGEENF